jgi:energy-coupling factor transport system permease protein
MEYLATNSPIHRFHPMIKLIGLCCFFCLGIVFSNLFILMAVIGLIYLLFRLAKATTIFWAYCRLLFFAGLFMMVLQLLFSHDGPELLRYIPRNIPVLGWLGVINRDSLMIGLVMVARMSVFGLSLPLIMATTQSRDLVMVIVERIKVPYQYALMFVTSLRFIPTLFVEIENILQAQKTRAFEMTSKNPVKQVKAYLPLITPLVIIALKKAERLAIAMETRGYGLGPRTYLRRLNFGPADYFAGAGCVILVLAAVSFRLLGWAV